MHRVEAVPAMGGVTDAHEAQRLPQGVGEPGGGGVPGIDAREIAFVHAEVGGVAAVVAGQNEGRQALHAQRQRRLIERDPNKRHARNIALPDLVAGEVGDHPFAVERQRAGRGDGCLLEAHAAERLDGIDPEFADENCCHLVLAAPVLADL